MKIQTVLYYRYLSRQTVSVFLFSIAISLTISLTLFLLKHELVFQIVAGLIWLLPIAFLILQLIYLFKYKKYFKHLENKELFSKITNKMVRQEVAKSRYQIKIMFPKKEQAENFFQIINTEIEKQKRTLNIIKKTYDKK